jgi:uncharacterized protein (DUF433 family)
MISPPRHVQSGQGRLRRARALVVSDAEILGGDPVFRGTRIPVHPIAAWVEQGATETELLKAYPRLAAKMIRLAPLYAQAYPLRGRPRKYAGPERPPVRRVRARL